MKKSYSFYCITLLALFFSCVDDYENQEEFNPNVIQCHIMVNELDATRGTPIQSADDESFKNLGLMAYHTTSEFAETPNPQSTFFSNKEVDKVTNNTWSLGQTYYWPQEGYISFFAYSPYVSSTNGITIEDNQSGAPVLNYTLPPLVENQPDLMIATPQMNLFKEVVKLDFSHALACISFDVSGENAPIEYIGVKGVYTTGTLSLNMSNKLPQWSNLGGLSENLYEVGLVTTPIATNPSQNVMATDGYLMMIPQTLDENAAIVIKFTGLNEKTIPFKTLSKNEWLAGYKYTYMLKEGVYDFSVTQNKAIYAYYGGDLELNFTSNYTNADGQVTNLGWTAEVLSSQPDNDPYWTDLFDGLSSTDGTLKSKSILINPSTFTTDNIEDKKLRETPTVPNSQMKDLSFVNGSYSTANTYVVNSSGWFKIPCTVMGNGVKQGENSSTANNESFLKQYPYFVDYKKNDIIKVKDLQINIADPTVELLWSDAPGLITDIKLSDDKRYIEFCVTSQALRQGNAVVAIKDGNKIAWSWQIWVTPWELNTDNKFLGNKLPNLMPYAIGRCSAANYSYDTRKITILFTQDVSGLTHKVTISQQPSIVSYGENASFYQWGRKDPMLAFNGLSHNDKVIFGSTLFQLSTTNVPVPLYEGILNPNIFYCSGSDYNSWFLPYNGRDFNIYLWGNYSENPKTIYDPSPIGYQVMVYNVLTAFPDMGYKYEYDKQPIGCYFSPIGGEEYSVFLAFYGSRLPTGDPLEFNTVPTTGFNWSAAPLGTNSFLNLIYPSSGPGSSPFYQANYSASGLNVYSVQEPSAGKAANTYIKAKRK